MKEIEVTVKKIKDPITVKRLGATILITMAIVGIVAVTKENFATGAFCFLGTGVLCVGIGLAIISLVFAFITLIFVSDKEKTDKYGNEPMGLIINL